MNLFINFAAFQLGWFASVIGGAQQVPWAGPAVVLIVVALHLYWSKAPIPELKLVAACGLIGAAFDSFLVASGWVTYPSGMFSSLMAPYWIIAMWMSFATTLNVSLGWLKGRPMLASALGLVSGPLTYIAGSKLGGITFLDQTSALIALGVGWALMMPILMWLASGLNGMSASRLNESPAS